MSRRRTGALAAAVLLASAIAAADEFVGWITDAECGANHAPMIAKGGMGKTDRECTLKCAEKGAPYGFVDEKTRAFYQLDDQDGPAPYAAERVRIEGRRDGDTIFVKKIERLKSPAPVSEPRGSAEPRPRGATSFRRPSTRS